MNTGTSGQSKRSLGQHYEDCALAYLQKQGLRLVARNFHSRFGEIDLILKDREAIVFVEVRYRQAETHGLAVETILPAKRRRIIKTASYFLHRKGLANAAPCRFDVLGISGAGDALQYRWIKGAFQAAQ